MLRFPVINEWACALMCASHAEDGCCTYKNNPKRIGDENDGDNYEAPQHIQRLTFLLRPCSLGRPEAPLVTTIILFTCWISFPKIFESPDFPRNKGPLLLPKKKVCQEDTGLCEFRAGFGGVDESQSEQWSSAQCTLAELAELGLANNANASHFRVSKIAGGCSML